MKKLIILAFLITSCSSWDSDGVDFRNYLRDRHPYCVLKEVELNTCFAYQVTDTIKKETWIYTSQMEKSSVYSVCIK